MRTGIGTRHKIRESLCTAILAAVIVCAPASSPSLSAQVLLTGLTGHPEGTLPPNGRIILAGRSESEREFLRGIADYSPQLIAEQDTVPLSVEKSYQANGESVQRVLVPERALTPGRTYRLSTMRQIPGTETMAWVVRDTADTIAPTWNGTAAYIGGCHREGESHYAYIALPLSENHTDEIAIETSVIAESLDGRAADTLELLFFPRESILEEFSEAILISDNVVLKLDSGPQGKQRVSVPEHLLLPVGEGIYGGGLRFEEGRTYRLSMSAIDAAGNRSATLEGRIEIPTRRKGHTLETPTAGSGTEGIAPTPHQPLIPRFDKMESHKEDVEKAESGRDSAY